MPDKLRVAVLFGGRSVEHEISVITALQLIAAIDPASYSVIPVYIAPNGSWFTGEQLLDRGFYKNVPSALDKLLEVSLLPKPGIGGLIKIDRGAGSSHQIIPVDLYLPVFHGQYGEDGCIQGLFELAQVPYTGCNVPASSITMNKYFCKMYLKQHNIPVLPAKMLARRKTQENLSEALQEIANTPELGTYPLFVKPCNLGSSIGVTKVDTPEQLPAALAKVFRYDTAALVEPCISQIMEINISVRAHNGVRHSVVEIPVSESGVLSYEEKYLRGGGKKGGPSEGMASLTRVIDPPDLDPQIREQVTEIATKAFTLLGCSGVARLDFIIDLATGLVYFNELNAFPGSCSFYLWIRSNPRVLYTELIDDMIQAALKDYQEQTSLDRNIGLKALKS